MPETSSSSYRPVPVRSKSKATTQQPLSRRQQLQALRQAANDGTILTAEQLAFTVGRSLAWVARLRSGSRVALAFRAWRVADGWQITTVDGARAVGQPLAPPN
jgi:hypothetical protein